MRVIALKIEFSSNGSFWKRNFLCTNINLNNFESLHFHPSLKTNFYSEITKCVEWCPWKCMWFPRSFYFGFIWLSFIIYLLICSFWILDLKTKWCCSDIILETFVKWVWIESWVINLHNEQQKHLWCGYLLNISSFPIFANI